MILEAAKLIRCTKCGNHKAPEEFSRDADRRCGRASRCKECKREECKAWRSTEGGKAKLKAARQRYKQERNALKPPKPPKVEKPTLDVVPCGKCGTTSGFKRASDSRPFRYSWKGQTLCHRCRYPKRQDAAGAEEDGPRTFPNLFVLQCQSYLQMGRTLAATREKPRKSVAWDALEPESATREILVRARRRTPGDLMALTSPQIRPVHAIYQYDARVK